MSTAANGKPVVLIAEELSPATVDALGPDFEIRHCNGADRAELLPAIAEADAILIRSATKVDAEAIAAAGKLKVVARAGVGLDNVDVSSATKAGVIGLTKTLGKELAQDGVIVNCVTPAVIETEILETVPQSHIDYMLSRSPMGRVGKAPEVAAMVAWLCSADCSFTTAGVFDLSGGRATY